MAENYPTLGPSGNSHSEFYFPHQMQHLQNNNIVEIDPTIQGMFQNDRFEESSINNSMMFQDNINGYNGAANIEDNR